jgi:hypothetical protein
MVLVVEDGTGLSTAESYLSEADADTYHTNHGNPTTWSSKTTAQKEEALRLATQYVDATYGGSWLGRRNLQAQALDWPRLGVTDFDGFTVDSDAVPRQVADATAEMAGRYAAGTTLFPDLTSPGTITSERVKVEGIEEEIHYVGGRSQVAQYRIVDQLLRDLVSSGNRIIRG